VDSKNSELKHGIIKVTVHIKQYVASLCLKQLPPPCWRYAILLQCDIINVYMCARKLLCVKLYGLRTNLGIRFFRFLQFDSLFDHAKYIPATRRRSLLLSSCHKLTACILILRVLSFSICQLSVQRYLCEVPSFLSFSSHTGRSTGRPQKPKTPTTDSDRSTVVCYRFPLGRPLNLDM